MQSGGGCRSDDPASQQDTRVRVVAGDMKTRRGLGGATGLSPRSRLLSFAGGTPHPQALPPQGRWQRRASRGSRAPSTSSDFRVSTKCRRAGAGTGRRVCTPTPALGGGRGRPRPALRRQGTKVARAPHARERLPLTAPVTVPVTNCRTSRQCPRFPGRAAEASEVAPVTQCPPRSWEPTGPRSPIPAPGFLPGGTPGFLQPLEQTSPSLGRLPRAPSFPPRVSSTHNPPRAVGQVHQGPTARHGALVRAACTA